MRVLLFSLLILLRFFDCKAQLQVKTYSEQIATGQILYVDNNEHVPVSIKLDLKLVNMSTSDGLKNIFVIPARTKKFKLKELTPIDPTHKYYVRGKTWVNYGNHFLTLERHNFKYNLPFRKGQRYKICQGYNGNYTHQGKNQLDFALPLDTPILAARNGLVIKVIDGFNKQCDQPSCEKYNNLIYIYHEDGTIAEYVHIKQHSSKVKVGNLVQQGQEIARSGNVGWTTGPHLHFSVFIQRLGDKREYLKTKFIIKNDISSVYLREGQYYSRP